MSAGDGTAAPHVSLAGPPAESRWRLGFWSLVATQFQSAFNDNGLKNLVVFIILGAGLDADHRDQLVFIIGGLFSLPFILFSMTGGFLADRFSKRSVTIWTKCFELGVMSLAILGLAQQNLHLEMAAVFLASTEGALFGPSKYGLLPELLPEPKLSWGNGVLELTTFVAIIVGGMSGAFLAEHFRGHHGQSGMIFLALSVVGLLMSFGIARVPAADPVKKFRANPLSDLWMQWRIIRNDRVLWLAVLGNTYFWFLGALLTANIVFYGSDVLKISETRTGILQAAVAIGIGLGSFAAGYLSGGKVEYGLIPLGAVGMTVFGILLSRPALSFEYVLGMLSALGFAAGFFAVPINALIQHRPDEKQKGGVIAAANLLSFVGIGGAAGVYYVLQHALKFSPPAIFLAASLVTVAATAYVLYLLPDALLRLLFWFATHSLYRIHVEGRDNVPERGGALLVPNHVSMVDAVLLIASIDRPIRFLMFKDSYEHPLVKPFAKIMGVIPISSGLRPREMIHSLRTATEALKNGEVVCIFPEGQMTRIGQMLPFRRGMERIVKGVDVPIIPVNLGGVWGSIFSFQRGRFFWKMPRKIPYPVTVTFGKPMPATTQRAGGAASGAGAGSRRLPLSQETHADTAPVVCADGAPAPVPFCHGGRPYPEAQLWQRAHTHRFSRAKAATSLAGPADGRDPAASVHPWCAGEPGGVADGKSPGQSELHRVERSAGLLRAAVRAEDGHHVEALSRENSGEACRPRPFYWKIWPRIPVLASACLRR